MVDPEMGRRVERMLAQSARHYAEDHRAMFPQHGAEAIEVGGAGGGIAAWGTAFGPPSVSQAFALGLGGEVTADDLSRVEAFYARHERGARVVVCPWTHASLFPLLAARGYCVRRFENVLTRTLAGTLPATAPGVDVARVPPGGAVAWGALVRIGFGFAEDDVHAATVDAVFDGSKTATLFLANVDGVPAGGGALVLIDGAAFLLATSVLEAHRRRGVHAALVAARLAHAREAGADLAVVNTDPGSDSQRNLERNCGFRVGYTETIFEIAQPSRLAVEGPGAHGALMV